MVKMILTYGGMHFWWFQVLEAFRYLNYDYSTAVDISQREVYQTHWWYINSKVANESRLADEDETPAHEEKIREGRIAFSLL